MIANIVLLMTNKITMCSQSVRIGNAITQGNVYKQPIFKKNRVIGCDQRAFLQFSLVC
ncbi:protein of unknown function [Legionella fallonii LLAP-10]|uniref:Uncharacterized protein n=1 Tax=Legionella fallonii LLAP-10 TaxID=1212491 RepID=A0A098G4H5_9GAMM|nr:protein of unknown function [Legionella fallonii LLAP-10]